MIASFSQLGVKLIISKIKLISSLLSFNHCSSVVRSTQSTERYLDAMLIVRINNDKLFFAKSSYPGLYHIV